MISTSPKRLRTTAWTINKNKKSQKAEGGKGRNFSASAFSNEGALICSGERTYGTEETGKNDKKTEAAPASPQNVSDGSSGGADLRRHLQRHPPCGKTASDITAVDYSGSDYEDNDITDWTGAPPIDVELLTPNSWSRPQTRLKKVDGIVIHYTANPGSTAMQNRDYFENLPETQEAQASSHFASASREKSFSVSRRVNGRMHRTSVISIRSRLNAATRMTAVNLPMRHTILWSSSPVSYASGSI